MGGFAAVLLKAASPPGRGAIYTRDGVLVASVAQEGLIRPR
jgi:acyl-CoA thioesterase